ncbi:MAG: hypothetical protein ACJA0N_001922 [Pseudohongiellaceae bacterium]
MFIIASVVIIAGHSLLVIVYKGVFVTAAAFKVSHKSLDEQIEVVADFHAHKIAPIRIAYRTGIDMQLVNQLLSGELKPRLFQYLLKQSRLKRREQRLKASLRHKGSGRLSLQDKIETDFGTDR